MDKVLVQNSELCWGEKKGKENVLSDCYVGFGVSFETLFQRTSIIIYLLKLTCILVLSRNWYVSLALLLYYCTQILYLQITITKYESE